ncbi:flagellar filament capping protein FliD [Halomonas elongata]|uniref:Flagellar hook-associated protein 2 n=1 Tax=Halomonas elongata (strain ATCC 33173 / DSM 2581 / NBRC 15536 / NCIMB 2198 / 1H9) TaxID=768066 RepID=E1VBT1_HALED|nr:flagellar filament capping protein FliD [Halomonas elongata]MDL4860881.1 flagellar filament capping protein FliD [Halomonas elongata]WBF18004.1 flagellar filament capping protein FliD [Halomonas elongata]WPU46853.1 flagellar filament capping protein FliD [Halomonas elongata DSM 2581]CBV44238.2 flagellar capping protein FliD [Halomonas elongata DSM 2581]
MASISSLGVGSGLDLGDLLDQLRSAERQKLDPIMSRKTQEQARISAYGRLQSGVSEFQEAVARLNDDALYQGLAASVQGEGLTASTTEDADPGRYEIAVTHTARAGSLASTRVADIAAPLTGANASLDLTFGDGSTTRIALAEGATLEDIRDTINADPDAGVDASIIHDGTGNRLVLNSRESGADAGVTQMSFNNLAGGVALEEDADTHQAGRDAELEINGIQITSASNTVEGAIQGVTLELDPTASGETLSLVVEQDNASVKEAVTALVDVYNKLKSTLGRMTAVTGDAASAGELVGDRTVRNIESSLSRNLVDPVGGGEVTMMSQLGISLQADGRLQLDVDKLDAVMADNPQALRDFLAGDNEDAGMAGRLAGTLGLMLGDDGTIQSAISGSETRVSSLERRYSRMEESIDSSIARYRQQFSQLDSVVARMNSVSAYLGQQLSMLDSQFNQN